MRTSHPARLTELRRITLKKSLYRCVCGTEKILTRGNVRNGATRSCGCLNREVASIGNRRHGMKHTHEHGVWGAMKQRCSNPKNTHYPRYGGRGISVCEEWKKFENFFADMGLAPTSRHTIEREDNDGNYCKSNCRWATYKEQANNRISTKRVTLDGVTLSLTDWTAKTGIPGKVVRKRIKRGWPIREALWLPLRSLISASPRG